MDIMQIEVTSHGKPIGRITVEQFLQSVQGPKNEFLSKTVERFNARKEQTGEPERVSIVIR